VLGVPVRPPHPVGLPIPPHPIGIVIPPHPVGLPIPPRPIGIVIPPRPVGLPIPPRPVGIIVHPPLGLPVLPRFQLNCSAPMGTEPISALQLTLLEGVNGTFEVSGTVTYTAGGQDLVQTDASGILGERIDLVLRNVGEIHLAKPLGGTLFQGSTMLYGNEDTYGLSCSLFRI